jgi:uncharacterized repeat protein (TIGR01451 family)
MNKVIKKSLIAAFLSVFVLSLGLSGTLIIPSTPVISIAHADGCAIGTAITNTANDLTPSVGEMITYTLNGTISNISDPTAVTVNDALSADLTFVSSTASVGTYSSSTGVWDLGTVSSSTSMPVSLEISATVNAGTEGKIIDSEPTINYSQSAGSGCAQSAAIDGWKMTVEGIPSAFLAITKTANPTSVVAGSTTTVDYTVTVTNNSTSTTSNGVVVNDLLPSGLIFESSTNPSAYNATSGVWTVGNLSAGSTASLSIYAEAAADASSTVTNTATVTASTTDSNSSNSAQATISVTQATSTPTSTTPSADLSISKTLSPSSTVAENVSSTVGYTITVTNNSTSTTSTNVVASDVLPSELTFENATATASTSYASSTGVWTIGNLLPSAVATLNINAFVNSAASSTLWNAATVSASTTDPNTANNTARVSINVQQPTSTTPSADISISKSVSPTSTIIGSTTTVNYTITVTNNSLATSTDVVASDTLPAGLTFESATTTVGTSTYATSTKTETWTIGDMSASSTATLNILALVDTSTSTTITNTATVSASTTDPNPSNNSSTILFFVQATSTPTSTTPSADLSISKAVTPSTVTPGSTTTVQYVITVTNNSTSTTSTAVVVNDPLPSGITFVSSTPSSSYNATSGVWTVGDLSAGASSTLMITAEVDSSVNSAVTNTATVSASTTDSNPVNTASATIAMQSSVCTSNCGGGGGGGGGGGSTQSNIAITKTVDSANPATGAVIHYTLTVTDGGPSDSSGVVASDTLPSGLTFNSASSSEGSYNSSTGIWTIGVIPDGQKATLVITATVTAAAGTTITNVGTVSENPGIINSTPGNDSSSATITVAGGGNNGGGGGGGGQVLGASTSTGQVLGASCGLYLTSYIHPYRQNLNDPTQVKKLQTFLNMNLGLNLPVTGYYGSATIAGVNQFQVKYHIEVLKPWLPLGLPTQFTPTSYVYQTTQRWINLIMCPSLNLSVPQLVVDQGGE